MSTIMLAKSFDVTKLEYPVEITIKLDGVAADFFKTTDGWQVQSRQAKPIPSAEYLLKWMDKHFRDVPAGVHIIAELLVHGEDAFKDAGGIIRRQEPDARITMHAYDMYREGQEDTEYADRKKWLTRAVNASQAESYVEIDDVLFRCVQCVPLHTVVHDEDGLMEYLSSVNDSIAKSDSVEGFVLRSTAGEHSTYKVGKRSYGMMKFKPKPTLDLEVVSFSEATANKTMTFLGQEYDKGDGLGAVGRINVKYNDTEIGVGPGCLTHEERRDLWNMWAKMDKVSIEGRGLIAEIEYMEDKNYTALRQPVFKRWRTDKSEASYEA